MPKPRRGDLCARIRVRNAGPEAAELHVLPTLWFRNRWSWEDGIARPTIRADGSSTFAEDDAIGRWRLIAGPNPAGQLPELALLRERKQRATAVWRRIANAVSEGRHQRPC